MRSVNTKDRIGRGGKSLMLRELDAERSDLYNLIIVVISNNSSTVVKFSKRI